MGFKGRLKKIKGNKKDKNKKEQEIYQVRNIDKTMELECYLNTSLGVAQRNRRRCQKMLDL